jgi:hypothetical protein
MLNVRIAITTLFCVGLLSTNAMGMPPEQAGAPGEPGSSVGSPHGQTGTTGVTGSSRSMDSRQQGTSTLGSGTKNQDSNLIIGEIINLQDEFYLVRVPSGKEVNLHVDHSSQVAGHPEEGDEIEAEVTPDGHVLKLQKTDPTSGPR